MIFRIFSIYLTGPHGSVQAHVRYVYLCRSHWKPLLRPSIPTQAWDLIEISFKYQQIPLTLGIQLPHQSSANDSPNSTEVLLFLVLWGLGDFEILKIKTVLLSALHKYNLRQKSWVRSSCFPISMPKLDTPRHVHSNPLPTPIQCCFGHDAFPCKSFGLQNTIERGDGGGQIIMQ